MVLEEACRGAVAAAILGAEAVRWAAAEVLLAAEAKAPVGAGAVASLGGVSHHLDRDPGLFHHSHALAHHLAQNLDPNPGPGPSPGPGPLLIVRAPEVRAIVGVAAHHDLVHLRKNLIGAHLRLPMAINVSWA